MSRSEEFHNGTHVLEPQTIENYAGQEGRVAYAGHCAKCATTFSGHDSPASVEASHRRYVGTPEQAQARRDRRDANDLVLQERYGDTVIGPRAVTEAAAKRKR